MWEDYSDYRFLVGGIILGIIFGILVGVPLWVATGASSYIRLSFFLGVLIGGATGAFLTNKTKRRKKRPKY